MVPFSSNVEYLTVILCDAAGTRRAEVELDPATTVAELIEEARRTWRLDPNIEYHLLYTQRTFDEHENASEIDVELDPEAALGSYDLPHHAVLTIRPMLVAGAGNAFAALRRARLEQERREVEALCRKIPELRIVSLEGNPCAPRGYVLEYRCSGLAGLDGERPVIADTHRVRIRVDENYPRPEARVECVFLTPILHMHVFRNNKVCLGDFGGPEYGLTDVILRVGRLIQCDPELLDFQSIANHDAVAWTRAMLRHLPLGERFGAKRRVVRKRSRPVFRSLES